MKTSIEKKISDYKRFTITLLILSSYLYIGTLISSFEYHTNLTVYLYPLIAVCLLTAFVMTLKIKKWKQTPAQE